MGFCESSFGVPLPVASLSPAGSHDHYPLSSRNRGLLYTNPYGLSSLTAVTRSLYSASSEYLNLTHPPPLAYPLPFGRGLASNWEIKDINAKRVVVDSVTTLYINKPSLARSIILQLKRVLAGTGCTSIFVSQISVGERGFGGPGVEHGVDGIIRLDLDEIDGELKRSLIVWKMRGTSHSMRRHPFEITDKGITVYANKVLMRGGVVEI